MALSHRSAEQRLDFSLMLLAFVAGLGLRLVLLRPASFDGLYGQDPYAYYDFAGELRQALIEGRWPQPFFWPLGYPALLAAVFALFGTAAKTGQSVNILLGAGLGPLVYLLTRRLGTGRQGAAAAALLIICCGQALQSSLVIMADIPALTWAVISALALWHYLNCPALRWLGVSAACLALAIITRWLYGILIIPWAAALLIDRRGRLPWRHTATAAGVLLCILLPQAAYSVSSPYPTLNHAWVEGWSPANAFRRAFTTVDGHLTYERPNWEFYALPFHDPYFLAAVFTPFAALGAAGLFWRRRYAKLALLAGWALLPYLFLAGIPYQNIRFPLIVSPAVAVLCGHGIDAFWSFAASSGSPYFSWRRASAGGFVCVIFALGLWQMAASARSTISAFIANQQRDKSVAQWVSRQIPENEVLYTFGITLTIRHYTQLEAHELYYESPETLAARWQPGQADYLLINVWNIENQWAGREPQLAYHWLRDERGLILLGRFDSYTLFRIRG